MVVRYFRLYLFLSLSYCFCSAEYCRIQEDSKMTLGCVVKDLESKFSSEFLNELLRADNLEIFCSPEASIFSVTTLQKDHFGNLSFLQKLQLKFCNIKRIENLAFQGLRSLKILDIQSFNQEWTSVTMELEKGLFRNVENLESLNLSTNNIQSFPKDAFCDLKQLKAVNLSRNHLLRVSDIEPVCSVPVEKLDISYNLIKELKIIKNWPKLKWLILSNNQLNLLEEDALNNVTSLLDLDLSSNKLIAIPDDFFNQTVNLNKLSLQNNSLTLLSPGIFKNLENLRVLNLSRNFLTSHLMDGEKTFHGLKHLQVLDLSFNKITKLEAKVYQNLKELKILKLDSNHIVALSSNVFATMVNLKVLTLSHNQMTNIQIESLEALKNLKTLYLDNNKLSSVHFIDEEQKSDMQLQDLSLNNNNLKKVPSFIRRCKKLHTLNLGENEIKDVEHFDGLKLLFGLSLSGNAITSIGNSTFSSLKSIRILNLSENQISSIEVGSLNELSDLRALRLDNNKLQDINGIVSSLRNLKWLSISSNGLSWFDYAFIPNSLEWLDLSNNSLEQLENYYSFENFQLRTLDASLNKINRVQQTSLLKSLEKINLSQNQVKEVAPFTFADMTYLKTLDLRKNQLSTLSEDALRLRNTKGQCEIYLADNPLTCACNLQWLKHNTKKITDLAEVECQIPTTKEISRLVNVPDSSFLCQYQTHCSNSCICCDFFACDCRFQCPQGCECFHNKKWDKNIVKCSNREHQHVPLLIPLDATKVMLDGNTLHHLDSQSFIGRNNIKTLQLNNSNIISLSNNTFAGLNNLETLHLENNQLTEIHGAEFADLFNLQELYLSSNNLFYISEKAFEGLQNLKTLTLDGNLLMTFPVWTLLNNPFLTGLNLARNSWSCDCNFIKPFNFFLERKSLIIKDYEDIQCLSDSIISENLRYKCPADNNSGTESTSDVVSDESLEGQRSDLLPYLIAVLIVATLVLVPCLSFIVFFRKPIKEWMYITSNKAYEPGSCCSGSSRTLPHVQSTQKLFDIYISYSLKEHDFVKKQLLPSLRNSKYKLCLQQQHLSTSDAISVATESSARILVILTRHYIHTEWQKVKGPMISSLHDKVMQKLIFVTLEELTDQESILNPELCNLLQKCQSVFYDSSESLVQLQRLLPEPALTTFHRNINTRNQINSRVVMPLPSVPNTTPDTYEPNANGSIFENEHAYHTLYDVKGKSLPGPQISQSGIPNLYHHYHSHSASSGTQLIPSQNKQQNEEYTV